jgi:hypothetical protein
MVLLEEVASLRAAARKWITKAAKAPAKLPKMANSTFWVVYENANPAMLIARREPGANASFVDNSDRRRLGTTIPARNKVNATSISSRASEKTFCVFMVFAFSFSRGPNRDTITGLSAGLQFDRRATRTNSRSAETLALYAPMRAASTGKPSRSATRRSIPTSWSSERLNPTTGRTRFAPEEQGATGLGGGRRRQRRCAISENCSQSCLSHIARPFLGEFDSDD